MKALRKTVIIALLISALPALCACGGNVPENADAAFEVVESEGTAFAGVESESVVSEGAAFADVVLEDVEPGGGKDSFTCSCEGTERRFTVYMPEEKSDDIPLIIMLHGFGNSPESFRMTTHMDELACPRGYAVVYASYSAGGGKSGADGWNFDANDGKDDTAFLTALARYMQEKYGCSKKDTFAAGFSNGAVMTWRLAADAAGTFSGIAAVAGPVPESVWESRAEETSVSVLQIYGSKDDVVPKIADGSYLTAKSPAAEDAAEYWAKAGGLEFAGEETLSDKATCKTWNAAGRNNLVKSIVIEGGRHAWPEAKYSGIDASEVILDFFDEIRGR